jgi:hypothetical protein
MLKLTLNINETNFYEKVGRRYQPVAEYDNTFLDSFEKGNHLVMCYPGGTSRRFHIDPAYAAMITAGRVAEDAVCRAYDHFMMVCVYLSSK